MSRDLCTDCARVFARSDLFRCGRRSLGDDETIEIRLCIDCLYRVNPYMQRDLIDAVFDGTHHKLATPNPESGPNAG